MARNFNPHPVSNYGKPDNRYQITLEDCGPHPMFIVRFCGEIIGKSRFYSSASILANGHNTITQS